MISKFLLAGGIALNGAAGANLGMLLMEHGPSWEGAITHMVVAFFLLGSAFLASHLEKRDDRG